MIGLGLAGRRDEALTVLNTMTQMARIQTFHTWTTYLRAWLDRRVPDMLAAQSSLSELKIMNDPEALFQIGILFCDVGEFDPGLNYVQRAIEKGYYVAQTLERRTQFDAIRDQPAFQSILAAAREGRDAVARRVPRRRRRAPPWTTMKTLARAQDKEEIVRRLRTIRADSARRWGRMSAHQMICHLSDSFLAVTGQRHVSPASGPLQRTVIKWIALYAPLKWPQGIPTRPEVDQEVGGTQAVALRRRRDATRDARRADHDAERLLRTDASDLRQDVRHRLDALGLPAHGSSPASVRVLMSVSGFSRTS